MLCAPLVTKLISVRSTVNTHIYTTANVLQIHDETDTAHDSRIYFFALSPSLHVRSVCQSPYRLFIGPMKNDTCKHTSINHRETPIIIDLCFTDYYFIYLFFCLFSRERASPPAVECEASIPSVLRPTVLLTRGHYGVHHLYSDHLLSDSTLDDRMHASPSKGRGGGRYALAHITSTPSHTRKINNHNSTEHSRDWRTIKIIIIIKKKK
eukprot:gene9440-6623_t